MREGRGRMSFNDGREYMGEFRGDVFEGVGVFRWRDGREVRGMWM